MSGIERVLRGALPGFLLLLAPAVLAADDAARVLVFGDSLTWGWVPSSPIVPEVRHRPEDRWTTALDEALGDGHELIVDGLNGRTTDVGDGANPTRNGAEALLPALRAHAPLDLVLLMLGTNDTKRGFERSAFEIALGAGRLIDLVRRASGAGRGDDAVPDVLLVSPPVLAARIDPGAADDFVGAREKTRWLGTVYAAVADAKGAHFFDAASVVSTDGADGIHLTAAANRTLGAALAEPVRDALGD